VVSSAAPVLTGEVDLRMDDAHVPCESIVAGKGLLLDTQCATNLLLARVVNRIFVSSEIIWT
jgi:hypothetical protein